MERITAVCLVCLCLIAPVCGAEAQSQETGSFSKGTHEIEGLLSYFESVDNVFGGRPRLKTALATVRYGWILNDQGSGIFFGNEEFLLEAFVGPTLDGPGSVWGGGTLIMRHNFAWGHHPVVVPYFQIGAGLIASDASSDERQFAVGLPVEFSLHGTFGMRWRLNRAWSINTEFGYRHISNAGLSSRNGGYDLIGGLIGLSRMF
jgi:Lipid A 3-O-deacylase (PagL)